MRRVPGGLDAGGLDPGRLVRRPRPVSPAPSLAASSSTVSLGVSPVARTAKGYPGFAYASPQPLGYGYGYGAGYAYVR